MLIFLNIINKIYYEYNISKFIIKIVLHHQPYSLDFSLQELQFVIEFYPCINLKPKL